MVQVALSTIPKGRHDDRIRQQKEVKLTFAQTIGQVPRHLNVQPKISLDGITFDQVSLEEFEPEDLDGDYEQEAWDEYDREFLADMEYMFEYGFCEDVETSFGSGKKHFSFEEQDAKREAKDNNYFCGWKKSSKARYQFLRHRRQHRRTFDVGFVDRHEVIGPDEDWNNWDEPAVRFSNDHRDASFWGRECFQKWAYHYPDCNHNYYHCSCVEEEDSEVCDITDYYCNCRSCSESRWMDSCCNWYDYGCLTLKEENDIRADDHNILYEADQFADMVEDAMFDEAYEANQRMRLDALRKPAPSLRGKGFSMEPAPSRRRLMGQPPLDPIKDSELDPEDMPQFRRSYLKAPKPAFLR
jgi:hypothetical protein